MFAVVKFWLIRPQIARHEGAIDDAVETKVKFCWFRWFCRCLVESVNEGAEGLLGGCASTGCEKSILCFVFLHKLMMHDAGFSSWLHQGMCHTNSVGAFSQQLNNPP